MSAELDRTTSAVGFTSMTARTLAEGIRKHPDASFRLIQPIVQNFVDLGREILDKVEHFDADWHIAVFEGVATAGPDLNPTIIELYRHLARELETAQLLADALASQGVVINGIGEFIKGLREAKAAVDYHDRDIGPEGEVMPSGLVELRDRAYDEYLRGETVAFEEMGD